MKLSSRHISIVINIIMLPQNQNSNDISAQIQSMNLLLAKGQLDEAQMLFNTITDLPWGDTGALTQLGTISAQLGEHIAAINIYTDLINNHPDNANYLDGLAQAYIDTGKLQEAKKLLEKAVAVNPDYYRPYIQLGYIAILQNQYPTAIAVLEKAMELKPGEPVIYKNLIIAYTQYDDLDQAFDYANKIVRLQPKDAEGYYYLGLVQKLYGRFDEAIASFEKAIRLNKKLGVAYYDIASSRKFSVADKVFIKNTEKILQSSMSASDRASIHFALGKIYNDCKEWDNAFDHYRQANLISKPAMLDGIAEEVFNKTHKVYNKKFNHQIDDYASDSEIPVFIVGMPRSGTTLVEQIIRSHPAGDGAGELNKIDVINNTICPVEKLSSYRQEVKKIINTEKISEHANSYLETLCLKKEGASRIVDKMHDNFIMLGLINRLFPKAHIIHLTRSPLDTGLSCYLMPFRGIHWATDMDWIVERYAWYRKVMDYWYSELPKGRMIEMRYEDLIENPEQEIRRLIASIGLEWDPACLEYYKEKGSVSTASFWQVRQPIYKSSSKRWVNYVKYISPLINGLGSYLDEDDIEELHRLGIGIKKKWYANLFS